MTLALVKTGCHLRLLSVYLSFSLLLASCSYSVVVVSKRGTPDPDPLNQTVGFYMGKNVQKKDTVVGLSVVQNGVQVSLDCPTAGFHSIEYKITFGDMLRNTFTFGKRRSVKVKYVCLKDTND